MRTISRTAVSEAKGSPWKEYEAFPRRDLSRNKVAYLFLGITYEALLWLGAG